MAVEDPTTSGFVVGWAGTKGHERSPNVNPRRYIINIDVAMQMLKEIARHADNPDGYRPVLGPKLGSNVLGPVQDTGHAIQDEVAPRLAPIGKLAVANLPGICVAAAARDWKPVVEDVVPS